MDGYKDNLSALLEGIRDVAASADTESLSRLADLLLESRKVFIYGSGRSGLVGQYFAVRLVQMGLDVHFVGDMTTPIIGRDDLTLIISNTGETVSAVQTANIARRIGSHVACITGSRYGKLAHASNTAIVLDTRGKGDGSWAPLGTLFEDAAMMMFDSVVPVLMRRLGIGEDDMRRRHAIWV